MQTARAYARPIRLRCRLMCVWCWWATLPPSSARDQQELLLQSALGKALIVAKGFGHVDVGARELCEQVGDPAQRFPSDQLLYVPELYRRKGDLLRRQGVAADEVEAWYRHSITSARSQAAKSLELRATMSLCRLWQGQGRQAEGRQLLAELYAWFSEGLETQDLLDAKALLFELASN